MSPELSPAVGSARGSVPPRALPTNGLVVSTTLPKLTIPTGLPPQSDLPTSPATLYLFGVNFEITLDGTPDGMHSLLKAYSVIYVLPEAFTKLTRESWLRLKPVLDKLKDS
jgi:hypothetical protein